jgi:hypothetical protein
MAIIPNGSMWPTPIPSCASRRDTVEQIQTAGFHRISGWRHGVGRNSRRARNTDGRSVFLAARLTVRFLVRSPLSFKD